MHSLLLLAVNTSGTTPAKVHRCHLHGFSPTGIVLSITDAWKQSPRLFRDWTTYAQDCSMRILKKIHSQKGVYGYEQCEQMECSLSCNL